MVYLISIQKDHENVEYFLEHCLPKSLGQLILCSGDYSSVIKPPIEKYIEILSDMSEKKDSELYYTPQLSVPTKKLLLHNFRITKEVMETIVHLSAHLSEQLYIESCNIETKNLKFSSEIEFTLPWISFSRCYGFNGESIGLDDELEDIIEAISNSQLKISLNKFWFNDFDRSFTRSNVESALKKKGLDSIAVEDF